MVTDVQKIVSYKMVLEMTAEEASWLKAVLQNAAGSGEPQPASNVRAAIFNALHQAGVK